MSDFKEVARHLIDPCPECGEPCIFSSDFKGLEVVGDVLGAFPKMGKLQVRVCLRCKKVFHNGKVEGDLECPAP